MMIGTIIIAVVGYSLSIVMVFMAVCSALMAKEQRNKSGEYFVCMVAFLLLAVAAAAVTRSLAGGL